MKGLLLLWEALCWAFDWWKYWTQKEIFWSRAENVFLVHSTKMCINGSMLLSQLNPHSIYSERKLQNKYFFVTTTKRRMLHRSLHSKSVPVHSLIKKEKCVELCWAEGTNNDEKYANGNFDVRFVHQTIPFNVCCLFLFVFFGLGTFLLDSTHLHFYQQKASFSIGGNRTQGRSVKKCFEVVNYLVCSSIR